MKVIEIEDIKGAVTRLFTHGSALLLIRELEGKTFEIPDSDIWRANMTVACSKCGGVDILRDASIMLNPNEQSPVEGVIVNSLIWGDLYFCSTCGEDTTVVDVDRGEDDTYIDIGGEG